MLLPILLSLFLLMAEARTKDFQCGGNDCVIPYDSEGNQNGLEVCYTDETKAEKIREVNWKNGKREGVARCFKKNKLDVEANFKDDALNGPFVEIEDDANGDRVTLMENNQEVGLSFSVKNGKVSGVHYCLIGEDAEFQAILSCKERDYDRYTPLLVTWKKEELEKRKKASAAEAKRLNGPQESKYNDGKIKAKWTNLNGDMHGKFLAYRENGNLKTDCEYKNGKEDGPCLEYDEEKRLDKRTTYQQGKVVKEELFFDNGKPERVTTKADEKKFCTVEYFDSGVKSVSYCVLDHYRRWYGTYDGNYESWYEDGSLAIKGSYSQGKPTGTWDHFENKVLQYQQFYENGLLAKTIEYKRTAPLHRWVREYFPDGSLKNEQKLEGLEGNKPQVI